MSAKNLLHDMALAPACGLTGILTLLHLLYHELKRLEHVLVVSRRGFGPGALELGGECLAVLGRDLALFGAEVGLVTYNDKGDPIDGLYGETWLAVVVACPYGTVGLCRRDNRVARPRKDGQETYKVVEDLVTNDARHLETLLAGHRIDNQVAMDANEVLRIQNAVLILASGVDDLGGKLLVLVPNDLAERVLDGRVVAVDKVAVDELHRQTRLADSSTADNGHLPLLGGRHRGGAGGRNQVGGEDAVRLVRVCRRLAGCRPPTRRNVT